MIITKEKLPLLINPVLAIAKHAGNFIMDVYNSDNFGVEAKGDDSPLTRADTAANDYIVSELKKLDPQLPIISEEHKEVPYDKRKNWETLWMVDPLDGTKEFIKRNGEFTVNIALIQNHKSIAGIVYLPVKDIMYWAIEGVGAYKIEDQNVSAIKVNSYSDQDEGLRIVCSRSHLNDKTQSFVDGFNKPELIATGSSLKFTTIAEGNAEIYPRLAPTMEWDTAAAQIILEAAGGEVISEDTGESMRYNKPNLLNSHFIARADRKE